MTATRVPIRFGPLAVVRPGSGGRALGQAGGITRTFRGWRWCGTSPMAATAARSARHAVSPAGGPGHRGAGLGGDRAGGRAHCRRRYRRACACRVPATTTAPGPAKAIGKGLVSNAFIAQWLVERYVAGRSQNSLVTSLARHGADLSAATLTGMCAAAGALLAPLEEAVTARSKTSWHLHADETVLAGVRPDAKQTARATAR